MADPNDLATAVPEMISAMVRRRSVGIFTDHAPGSHEISLMLEAAMSVPDHGRLRPWRFVIIRAEGRRRFADALAAAASECLPEATDQALDKARHKAWIAPLQLAIIAAPVEHPTIPEWEQLASASCTGLAILLAADALGYGAGWRTNAHRDAPAIRRFFELRHGERLLGWINIGASAQPRIDRRRSFDLTDYTAVVDP